MKCLWFVWSDVYQSMDVVVLCREESWVVCVAGVCQWMCFFQCI